MPWRWHLACTAINACLKHAYRWNTAGWKRAAWSRGVLGIARIEDNAEKLRELRCELLLHERLHNHVYGLRAGPVERLQRRRQGRWPGGDCCPKRFGLPSRRAVF